MSNDSVEPSSAEFVGQRCLRRIAWLTPVFGASAAVAALVANRPDWAKGLLLGSLLGWLNFRWLKRGAEAFVVAATDQAGSENPRASAWTYFVAVFRYALLAVGVYVIFYYLHVPLLSIVVGLCTLGVATLTASVWEILHPAD